MSELNTHTLRDNHCHESDFLPSRYHACFSVAVSLRLNLPPRPLDCRCHHFIGVVVGGYLLSYQIAVALVERDRRATDKRSAGLRKSGGVGHGGTSARPQRLFLRMGSSYILPPGYQPDRAAWVFVTRSHEIMAASIIHIQRHLEAIPAPQPPPSKQTYFAVVHSARPPARARAMSRLIDYWTTPLVRSMGGKEKKNGMK